MKTLLLSARSLVVVGATCASLVLGCAGEDGATGPQGEMGAPGERGAPGEVGEPGATGPQGETGATGAQGEMGADGEPGDDGATGAMGVMGTMGDPGAPGSDGDDAPIRPAGLQLGFLGRYETGSFDEAAAEIVAYDTETSRVFVVNAQDQTVDVLDIANPATPSLVDTIVVSDAAPLASLGPANSVAVSNGLLAVAIESDPKTDDGLVAFYDTDTLELLGTATVGALPDMLTFTPDGARVLVANEGEPNDDYSVDPEGSISVITVPTTFGGAITVQAATFADFDADIAELRTAGVRIFGPGASVSQDLEPEYIALSADGTTAYVTLQENNAIAVVDVATASVVDVLALGLKNHNLLGNEFDPSDRDNGTFLRNWPVFGMYMPDAIAAYEVAGETYLVTANEGDSREWGATVDAARVGSLTLDATAFPNAAALQANAALGRLNVSRYTGDTDNDGDIDVLHSLGGRSFSIWSASNGALVYDSGNEFELRLAKRLGANFNSNHTSNGSGESRSDDKGPEPEAVTLANIGGSTFAFIGLERTSGVMVYDITLPETPRFVSFASSRNFGVDFDGDVPSELSEAGDLGPESVVFIPASDSPTDQALLVVGNEVSGTTAFFSVTPVYGFIE